MAIRIECTEEGWEDIWVDYQNEGWTFGARRRIQEATTDVELVEAIIEFVEDWNMLDINHEPVPFDADKGANLFNDVDDPVVFPWFISSWYDARMKRGEVSKNS